MADRNAQCIPARGVQVTQLEEHVAPLRTGKVTISAADNEALERVLSDYLAAWQRRKRMFNDVWCALRPGSRACELCLAMDAQGGGKAALRHCTQGPDAPRSPHERRRCAGTPWLMASVAKKRYV